jgi:hypothetical protein
MLGIGIPYLICVPVWSRIVLLVHWGCIVKETKAMHSSRGSGSHPLPSRHDGRVDVVNMWSWPPLIVNGVSLGSDGEEVKMPSPPRTIPNMGSKCPLRFYLYGINNRVSNYSPCSLGLQ